MKTKTLVSCLTGGLLVAACGSEAPPTEPTEADDLEGDPVVIATAEAVATAAATLTATGAGGAASAATAGAATTKSGTAESAAASSGSGGSSAEASSSTESGGAAGAASGQGGAGGSPDVATEGISTGSSGAGVAGQPVTTGEPPAPPLVIGAVLITEYVENGNDKAVELSNLSTNTVSLAACRLEIYFNGNSEPGNTVELAVDLAPGRSHVLCRSSSSAELLAGCDQTASLSFNGNDTVVLRCDDLVHDSFGQLGSDPGTAWLSGEPSGTGPWHGAFGSADHVLRRRCGAAPRTQPTDPFEVALTLDWFPVWSFRAPPSTGAAYDGVGDSACTAPEPAAGAGGAASLE